MFRLVRFSAQIRLLMFILEIVHRAAGEVNVSGFEKPGWSIVRYDSECFCITKAWVEHRCRHIAIADAILQLLMQLV